MPQDSIRAGQPWVSCFLTDILISYLEERHAGDAGIDYVGLFRSVEGFEIPSDPERFLRDVTNWVPLPILRELLWQCQRLSGRSNIAYHAALAYFDPRKKDLLSLFKIVFRVLNNVRAVFLSSGLWAAVQTNYLKLQSFEKPGFPPALYLLAQFGENVRPALGSLDFLRGLAEGFPRLYPFIENVECVEEISQLQIEDILRQFPDYTLTQEGTHLSVRHRASHQPVVEAIRVPLQSEVIPLPGDFWLGMPDAAVVDPDNGRIAVLTSAEETDPQRRPRAAMACKIVTPGVVSSGSLSYSFVPDQILNAPYSRFRVLWEERAPQPGPLAVEDVRREVSQLLFEHLKQIRNTQVRMVQYGIEKGRLVLENIRLKREVEREYSFAGMIGQSPKMQEVFALVRSLAETDVVGLIQGETGTGKELIARAIHYNSSRRAKRFVAVNCGALAETLLESELFGHEKGAFTGAIARRRGVFEAADGGTLFLDEIGEISPNTQVRLLRVLQDGEFQRVGGTEPIRVDVRILSATNQDLEDLVKKGRFRQDLFYRLNVFPIRVPPLRERTEDIPLLVSHFIEKYNRKMNKQMSGVSPQAMALLMAYGWLGNVRQLENVIQRMMVVARGDSLALDDLPKELRGREEGPAERPKDLRGIARESAQLVEKKAVLDALSKSGGNVTKAARSLGISRATMQNRIKVYGLRESRK